MAIAISFDYRHQITTFAKVSTQAVAIGLYGEWIDFYPGTLTWIGLRELLRVFAPG
jgi:hypothetical protein